MINRELIAKSDFIISFGSMLADNKEDIRNSIIESIAKTNAKFTYMHPIDNIDLKLYYTQFIKYEVGSEEGICALLMDTFIKECDEKTRKFINDLDLGYISGESSAGEEEFEEAYSNYLEAKNKLLIIGDDLIEHEKIENIIKLLALIKKYTNFELIVLNEDLGNKINLCTNFDLDEIEELKSFNGTLVYKLFDDNQKDELIASKTFANIAKVVNGDEIYINSKDEKIKKTLKVDETLNGTIAILKVKNSDDIFNGYRYKQVKIEKVEA
jgi:NADH-quinone oxidoreductase subunit F